MPSAHETATMRDAELLTEAHEAYWPQAVLADDVADGLVERGRPQNVSNLKNAAAGLPGGKYRLSVRDGGGDRLFQKDMLARMKGLLGGNSMKMVGQGD